MNRRKGELTFTDTSMWLWLIVVILLACASEVYPSEPKLTINRELEALERIAVAEEAQAKHLEAMARWLYEPDNEVKIIHRHECDDIFVGEPGGIVFND